MKKLQLLFIFLLLSVISFGQLSVTVPTITATAGQTVNIPVKLFGASNTGTPISSANLHITYDTAKLAYVNTVNFYSGTPASEWYFSGNFDPDAACNTFTAAANWLQTSMLTVAIPDGTTLYEIQFLVKQGNCPLNFCINEFTDAGFNLVSNTPTNGAVNSIPASLSGPTSVCQNSTGHVYTTDAGKTNYTWIITGGTITAGGTSTSNTATVTWTSAGAQSISVAYTGVPQGTLAVTVTAGPPASVSIAASANPVCAGASVTYTATPVNGGSTPLYQWKKNGTNVGSNSATYSYVPVASDVITCVMTSGLSCVNGSPATSNSVTMTVNPLTASVSIAASATTVVAGTTVTYTATPVNGGTTPFYQWKVNNANAGTNSPAFNYVPSNGDVVFCLMTSNAPCVSSIFTSNLITMTVTNPVVAPILTTVSTKIAIPGQKVYFPVKIKGASASGTPISSANIQLSYNPAVLQYDTIINFYSATPGSQWFFSGNSNTVAANWIEPNLLTIAIPDSTTLFEIRFTYIGGNATLPFTVYEFTDGSYNLVSASKVDGAIAPISPLSGYFSCDFHQHTTFTDGSYSFAYMMLKNNQYGLTWWANSEHGGGFNRDGTVSGIDLGNLANPVYFDSYVPNPIIGTVNSSGGHQNMWRWQSIRDYAYQNTQAARALYSANMIFQSYEMNVPGHEHAGLGIINNQFASSSNCNPLAEFEFKFDGSDADLTGGVAQGWTKSTLSGHAKAVEAVTWLHTNYPNTSYMVTAHAERKSLNNIQSFRDMNTAGPDVCFGFESMPGHQKAANRGEYGGTNTTVGGSTFGGCGIYSAQVGGLWDAMLSEGRHWWLFASSDFHATDADFYPGEYQKTYSYIANRTVPQSYIDGLRSGNAFVVEGDLIDSLDFRLGNTAAMPLYATMGQTFSTTQTNVVVKIKFRDPQGNNNNTYSAYTNPSVNHVDLIKGKVRGMYSPTNPKYSVDTVGSTSLIARFDAVGGVSSPNGITSIAWTDLGNGWKEVNYTYNGLADSVYFRLRGTNQALNVTNETDANGNPLSDALTAPNSAAKAFADLWFYSNPVFVTGPTSPTLNGPTSACVGSTGNLYTTESGKTNYAWNITGGMITSGGTSTSNTATVTWNTSGSRSISVSYLNSAVKTLPVTVNSILPATVSIAASANPGCAGTTITFTATPVNGGSTPVYQWKNNGNNVGTNSATYAFAPVNNDAITCIMTSNQACVTGSPSTSNIVTMTVNPVTASISIGASATTVVSGTSVTFTATPVNGGLTPVYQWKVNGNNAGTNSASFAYTPSNGDAVFCLLTSSAPCVTSIFTSNLITITVTNPVTSPILATISTKTAFPGQKVVFPVKIKGASVSGIPVSSANIQISYNPAVLAYDTIINFYSATPSAQWFFSGNNSTVAANWMEPSLLTVSVPDSTTLFEIRFTYLGGSTTLPVIVYEFTDAAYNLVSSNHVDGGISPVTQMSGYFACDFHQHTTYTDGSYSFGYMMQKNNQYGITWWANSEHGGGFNRDGSVSGIDLGNLATPVYFDSYVPNPIIGTVNSSGGHQNMWRWQSLRDYSFQNTIAARAMYSSNTVLQSYEFNVPGHEHAGLGLINNQFTSTPNCNPLAEFEFKFDGSDLDLTGGVAQGWTKSTLAGHAKAVEAITWLHNNYPTTSYMVTAHAERKSLNNIQGFRDLNNAGPEVCFGFESMPGHQKAANRGEYGGTNTTVGGSTFGGTGIYSAKVGGLWDAMLSEGRHWWLFASSDFHSTDADFYPGEYQKTYAYVANRANPQSYIDALRSGNSFVVEGDLIDSLDFRVGNTSTMPVYATIGQTFNAANNAVAVKIRFRDPQGNNNNTYSSYINPSVNHVDLIKGKVGSLISPTSPNYSVDTVTTTAVIARFDATGGVSSPNGIVSTAWTDLGNGWRQISYTYNGLVDSVYFRLRGSNMALNVANETDANGNPLSDALTAPNSAAKAFSDLWFYSNPIFVNGPAAQAGYAAGDFHQHSTYTDGSYSIAYVMQKNNQYGLQWWANSEHGGGFGTDGANSGLDLATTVYWDSYIPNPIIGTVNSSGGHQNMWRWQSLRDYAYQNIKAARLAYPSKMIIQSYELNVPGHEHASLGLINNQFSNPSNCNPLAEFEFKFDNSDVDLIGGVAQGWTKSALTGHAKAVAAMTWLQTNYPATSYMVTAHAERKNLNNIQSFRDLNNAGPSVCFGFESMPGHQKAVDRGEYKLSNNTVGTSTYGGCGIYAAKVGGLWDAMISEGRHWWLFSSSDFHETTGDFYPGEYQKTYTYVSNKSNPQSYIDGLRSGNSFVVEGDLIDSLDFRVGNTAAMPVYANMGQTFPTTQTSVVVKIKIRDPQGNNNNTYSSYTNPSVDHIDLIKGKVRSMIAPTSPKYSVDTVGSTAVIARFDAVGGVTSPNGITSTAWTDLGNGYKEVNFTYNNLADSVYFRLRGTNQPLNTPNETDANGEPLSDALMAPNTAAKAFADLWFYANPVFVAGPKTPALSGPVSACQGSTGNVYSTDAGKTSYSWNVTGGTITAGGTSTANTATVTWTSAGARNISVSYNGSVTKTLNVTVNPLPVPTVSGPASSCVGVTSNTYITEASMSGYIWTVSAGGTITSGNGTNSITVTWNTAGAQTVSVNYNNSNGCTATAPTVYNVSVNSIPVPVISGPASACLNSTGNVYTTQVGMSNYIWTVSPGGIITSGAGTNTITVSWNTTGAKTVTVIYSNAGGCAATTPTVYNVTINSLPVPTVAGPTSICAGTNGNIYSTEAGMTAYVWTVSAGGSITSGAGTSTISVNWNSAGSQTVTVNYSNTSGCSATAPTIYNVTVNPLPVPVIFGPVAVCVNSAGNVYTTQTGMSNYVWMISPGGTVTAGGNSTSNFVTITWVTSGPKTVSVNYANAYGCTAASAAVYNVNVSAVPVPTITGPASLCANAGYDTYTTEAGNNGYVWTVSAGGLINSGQGTNYIQVYWGIAGAQTVSVNYSTPGGCSATTPTQLNVTVNTIPGQAGAINGPSTVCGGTTGVSYSVTSVANALSYAWSLPAGATIVSGQYTNSILVDFAANASSGPITVSGNNLCGNGPASAPLNLTVNALPAAAGTITGTASVCQGTSVVIYTVSAISNATGYSWSLPSGATIVSGGNTNSITVNFSNSANSGILTVLGTNSCGAGIVSPPYSITVNPIPSQPTVTASGNTLTSSAANGNQWYHNGTAVSGANSQAYVVPAGNPGYYWTIVTINGCSSDSSNHVYVSGVGVQENGSLSFNVYPVPNNGLFTAEVSSSSEETYRIQIYNTLGVMVYKTEEFRVIGTHKEIIDVRRLAAGVYSVVFTNSERKEVRKIFINK